MKNLFLLSFHSTPLPQKINISRLYGIVLETTHLYKCFGVTLKIFKNWTKEV